MSDILIKTGSDSWQMVDVDAITPYERNAKIHSEEQVGRLQASIEQFGFVRPLLVDESLRLLAGHGMLAAAKASGMTQVPCLVVSGLSEAQARAYIHADNKLSELASWDEALLREELLELDLMGMDMAELGFEMPAEVPVEPLDLAEEQETSSATAGTPVHCPKCGFVFEVS